MRNTIRSVVYLISILSGLLLLIYAFCGWRFDIVFFGYSDYGTYAWYGIGAMVIPVLLFIWGFTIGLWITGISILILIGALVFGVIFDKENEVDVPSKLVVSSFIALGLGLLAMFFGSEEAHEEREEYARAKIEHDNSPVVCAKCDQYLGIAESFESPCPKCRSNRYSIE